MKFFVLLQSIDVGYFGYIFAIFPFCTVLSKLIILSLRISTILSNVMTYAPCWVRCHGSVETFFIQVSKTIKGRARQVFACRIDAATRHELQIIKFTFVNILMTYILILTPD